MRRSSPETKPIRGRALLFFLILGLLAGAGGFAWIQRQPVETKIVDSPVLLARDRVPETTAASTTTVAETTVPSVQVEQPRATKRAVTPPRNPYAQEPIIEIGTMEIPKIGLSHRIYHGITLRNIDRGPSHWPGTAFPGEVGNAVFAGHRVTHSRPFRHIDQLVPGDDVFFTIEGIRTHYTVTGSEIVNPDALWITNPTPTPTATLFACHPPGSARKRYVVRLALVAG